MIQTIQVIVKDQLNDQNNGYFTVTYPRGTTSVLSIQPSGSVETRVQGTAGPYESCIKTSKGLLYQPGNGDCYLVPYVEN